MDDNYCDQDPQDDESDLSPPPQDTIVVKLSPDPSVADDDDDDDDNKMESPANDDEENEDAVMEDQSAMLNSRLRQRKPVHASDKDAAQPLRPRPARRLGRVIKRRRLPRKWDADRLITDPKSPLAKANLRTILSNPIAWSCLDPQDQIEILTLFPDQRHVLSRQDGAGEDAGGTRPDMQSLMNDDSFRHDCAAYTENLRQGRHNGEWLEQAWSASERRRVGDFDEFLRSRFLESWGVAPPEEADEDVIKQDEDLVSKDEDVVEEDGGVVKLGEIVVKQDESVVKQDEDVVKSEGGADASNGKLI